MPKRHRRVVTGHDAKARAVVLMDGESPHRFFLEKAGGLQLTELWESEGLSFSTAPLENELEFAGPIKAKLWVLSSTDDMDLFRDAARALDPQGKEVTFLSAVEPKAPVSQGWLRVSQRKLDAKRSTEWQPWHAHDEAQKLKPGEIYEVDLEIWPASLALPAGFRLALTLQGKDFERPGETGTQKGSGWFLHDDARDRPPSSFGGTHSVYSGGGRDSYLLLPLLRGERSD
jgi:predicted acyl esterase